MPGGFEHFDLITGQLGQIRCNALGQVHAEALGGDRMAVLHAGVAHRHFRQAGPLGQQLGHMHGVGTALADVQQQVLALASGLERRQLVDLKSSGVVRMRADSNGAPNASGSGIMPPPAAPPPVRRCLLHGR